MMVGRGGNDDRRQIQHSHCCQQRWISKERTKERVCVSWKLEWMFVVVTGGWLRGKITATATNPSLCRWSSNHSYQHLRIRANFHHNTLFLLAKSFFSVFHKYRFLGQITLAGYDNRMKRTTVCSAIRKTFASETFDNTEQIVTGASFKLKQSNSRKFAYLERVVGVQFLRASRVVCFSGIYGKTDNQVNCDCKILRELQESKTLRKFKLVL